jgi:multicomponent K+:H+ antiporter subunit C
MELLVASAIGLLTSSGLYLVLRLRTFPVIMGISLLTYAVNVFLFASGRLVVGAPPILQDGVSGFFWNDCCRGDDCARRIFGFE